MNESLWLDEATTALVSKMSLGDIFNKFLPGDFHPPLYYLLMKLWVGVFGASEISLRFPSLIFALLTVYLVYKMFGKVSALLLLTAPLLFYYAQEARMYSMTTFLFTILIFSFVKITNRGRVGDWVVLAISLGLLAMTDYVALLAIPLLWAFSIMKNFNASWWKKFITSHIILLVLGVAWLPYFLKQLSSGANVISNSPAWSQVLGSASVKNFLLIPIKFIIGRVGFDNNFLYAVVVGFIMLLFGFLLIKGKKESAIAWLWFEIPLALGVIISLKIPVLSYFRFLFVLPAFYALIGRGIGKSRFFLWLVLAVNILSITYYMITPRFHREDWRGAAAAIGSDEIVFPVDSQKEALIYYGKAEQIVTKPKSKEIWLSRYVWELFDPDDTTRAEIEGLEYNKIGEYNFNGVVFYKYARSY